MKERRPWIAFSPMTCSDALIVQFGRSFRRFWTRPSRASSEMKQPSVRRRPRPHSSSSSVGGWPTRCEDGQKDTLHFAGVGCCAEFLFACLRETTPRRTVTTPHSPKQLPVRARPRLQEPCAEQGARSTTISAVRHPFVWHVCAAAFAFYRMFINGTGGRERERAF